ncbi:MAG TPA: ComEC/Rec2 family competence protein [Spirochaetia bacterium]|nr:ComEC/Rec2 family competence protein [Spirochaetia bacterium]
MKWRWWILVVILIFRFSLGWIETSKFEPNIRIRVTGNIDTIYQNDTECIISLGRFWIDFRDNCLFTRKTKVSIIGRVSGGVIDKLLGRLWLGSAEILVYDDKTVSKLSDGYFLRLLSIFREKNVNVYRRFLPEAESSLVAGIILGYKKDIGQKMYEMMVKSGTIHIAVASGYNIMLVGGTVLSICFWFCKRKWASVLAVVAMIIYAVEAGGEPPVIRAVIMAGVVFWAAVIGRKSLSWWVLLVTGWLMVLVEPLLLLNVSFQLSMAASVGLMIVEPWMSKILDKNHEKLAQVLGGSGVTTSFSTMLTTAPIIWWHFGRMSWIGIVSNILILPLVPILMITGAMMQIFPGVFYWPTYVVAHWMVEVIRFFGS